MLPFFKHLLGLAACSLMVSVLPLAAQAQPSTPEATATGYMDAIKTQDWMEAARLIHPDDLHAFKALFVQAADSAVARGEDVQEVLELVGLNTPEAMREAAPASLFAQFIAQVMEEQMGGVQENDDPGSTPEAIFQSMTYSNPTRLSEAEDVVYLTMEVRLSIGGEPMAYSEVLEVKRHEDRWMIGITQMIQAIEFQLLPADTEY